MLFISASPRTGFLLTIALALHSSLPVHAKVTRYLGASITIDNVPFYIHPETAGRLPAESMPPRDEESDWIPITIIDAAWDLGQEALHELISSYRARDDVFNEGFLQALYVRTANSSITTDLQWSTANSTATFLSTLTSKEPVDLPAGPYVVSQSKGTIHVPYRLYSDVQSSFHQGVVPMAGDSYMALPAAIPGASAMTIGVPSRLYCTPSADKPLCGLRLGVKDIYDLRGLRTGAGSRAYYATFAEAEQTAVVVERLVAAGAVVVGKLKTTQFAAPENAQDAIDYQAPFNPRGDGYLQPGSSSSGAGTAMASYDWLDLALGSDTGGSVRVPAQANGVFGNRPSHEMVPLTNVVPLGPQFDTPGFLVRDADVWSSAIRVLYSGLEGGSTKYPSKIVTMDIPSEGPAVGVYSDFIQKLGDFLSVSVSTDFDLSAAWTQSRPANTPADIQDLLSTTWAVLSGQGQIQLVKNGFFCAYAERNDGREPYVNPPTLGAWTWASTLPDLIEEAVANKTIFQNWWNNVVMPRHPESCSESLMLYVFQPPLFPLTEPSYVFTYNSMAITTSTEPGVLLGLNTGFISPMAGNPDYVVPVGEVEYQSQVTKKVEKLPLSIRMMAARGCDQMLADLVADLDKEGIIPKIKTGRSMLGGDVLF